MLAASVIVASCVKDETNRAYSDLNLPVIDNPDSDPSLFVENHQYSVKFGDILEITPAVSYSDMADLSYEWKIDGKTVSTEKDLTWECDLEGQRASGAFYITRNSVGNSVILRFSVVVDQPYSRGWLIAAEKGGFVGYSFLQEVVASPYQYTQYPDALETQSTAESWLDCMEFWSNETSSVNGHMLTLDSDPAKSFSVEELTMQPTVTLQQEFINEAFPEDVTFTEAMYCGYVGYLLGDDGKLYYRKSQNGYYTGRFSNLPLKYEGEDLVVSAMISGPYDAGIAIIYDSANDRFLMIDNGYNDYVNTNAGTVSEFPDDSQFRSFAGEEIVYSRLIAPTYTFFGDPYSLFIISKDASGQFYATEYSLTIDGGLVTVEQSYSKAPIGHFGENSVVTALDSPDYGMNYVYYTNGDSRNELYCLRRTGSGLSDPVLYGTFGADIVSIDQGIINRTNKTIGIGLANGTFMLLNLTSDMDTYIAPDGENTNSLTHEWKDVGNILKVDFRYGNIANY